MGQPFIRGFQCNDVTIRYPYKDSTVSSGVCYFVGSGLNVLLIIILEYLALVRASENSDRSENGHFDMKLYARNVFCRLLVWLFGSISSELLTDISKFTAGRLRPHFIGVCKPVIRNISGGPDIPLDQYCRTSLNPYEYITDYHCDGNPKMQRDARLSFLSGHSSYSAFSAAFAVIYIQSAFDFSRLGLIKPSAQILIISAAFYTGLTRVSDYKHHWQDVLAGLTLGTVVASFVHAYIWPSFYKTYTSYLKNPNQRAQPVQGGEELNSFSY